MSSILDEDVESVTRIIREYTIMRRPTRELSRLLRATCGQQVDALSEASKTANALLAASPPAAPRDVILAVLRKHSSPEMVTRATHAIAILERWWDASVKANLPQLANAAMPGSEASESVPSLYTLLTGSRGWADARAQASPPGAPH